MSEWLLILDFDGSFTILEEEAGPFCEAYLADVADLVGTQGNTFEAKVRSAEAVILADPENHGWRSNGFIVAPALVDPYVRIRTIAELVLAESGWTDQAQRDRVLELLFKHHAPSVQSVFKPSALETLIGIPRDRVEAYVVTNSRTDTVRGKLERLGTNGGGRNALHWLLDRIRGGAKKNVVDPSFDKITEHFTLPGLGRPVHLRRREYFKVIDEIRCLHGLDWSRVAVAGDILELDLILPFALGAHIGLLHNERTPTYEREFMRSNAPRARLLDDPRDILAFFE